MLSSPNKLYVIRNSVPSANENSDLLYSEVPDELLLFERNAKTHGRMLLKYHRNVDVFWAPSSKMFVVNDWKDNNYCDALLYDLGNLKKKKSLKQKLIASGISKQEKILIANKEYSYVFVKQWNNSSELILKASGHYFEDKKAVEYTLHYLWNMKTDRWRLLKKESVENLERSVPNLKQFGA